MQLRTYTGIQNIKREKKRERKRERELDPERERENKFYCCQHKQRRKILCNWNETVWVCVCLFVRLFVYVYMAECVFVLVWSFFFFLSLLLLLLNKCLLFYFLLFLCAKNGKKGPLFIMNPFFNARFLFFVCSPCFLFLSVSCVYVRVCKLV